MMLKIWFEEALLASPLRHQLCVMPSAYPALSVTPGGVPPLPKGEAR
jgi:hypothetical protein